MAEIVRSENECLVVVEGKRRFVAPDEYRCIFWCYKNNIELAEFAKANE